jgi:hypothetical protein
MHCYAKRNEHNYCSVSDPITLNILCTMQSDFKWPNQEVLCQWDIQKLVLEGYTHSRWIEKTKFRTKRLKLECIRKNLFLGFLTFRLSTLILGSCIQIFPWIFHAYISNNRRNWDVCKMQLFLVDFGLKTHKKRLKIGW